MPSQHPLFSLASVDGQLSAQLSAAGGILSSLTHSVPGAAAYSVFYRAPWLDDPVACANLPPLMQRLAGEWVGVPFGHSARDGDGFFHHASHGLPVNGIWDVIAHHHNAIQVQFHFPADYPLSRLQREITLHQDGLITFKLLIEARRPCRLPIGLHPIFPVGGEAGEVMLSAEDLQQGMVYPRATEAGGHCCKVCDEVAFSIIERSYLSKTLLNRRISPRGCPK